MHEVGLATEMHRLCRQRLAAADPRGSAAHLVSVTVAIGELAAVDPEQLQYAWSAVVADTVDTGSRLNVDWRFAQQVCRNCGAHPTRPANGWLPACPNCQQPLAIRGGDELQVLSCDWEPASS